MRVFFGADFLFHKEKVRGKGFEPSQALSQQVLSLSPLAVSDTPAFLTLVA